jgi:hypothetical protein
VYVYPKDKTASSLSHVPPSILGTADVHRSSTIDLQVPSWIPIVQAERILRGEARSPTHESLRPYEPMNLGEVHLLSWSQRLSLAGWSIAQIGGTFECGSAKRLMRCCPVELKKLEVMIWHLV